MKIEQWSLDDFVGACYTVEGFSFVRFGDGEFYCIRGLKGENCDGVVYTPESRDKLIEVLRNKYLYHSISSIALHQSEPDKVLKDLGLNVKWYSLDFIYEASLNGTLYPFIEFLRTKRTILVGPKHLKSFNGIPRLEYITCPSPNAMQVVRLLERDIVRSVLENKADAVVISAGFAAKYLVHLLHYRLPHVTLLDLGSLWDMYAGIMSRGYARKLQKHRIEELRALNFRQGVLA